MTAPLLIAKSGDKPLCLLPRMANRHGLVAGATGTGKSVTLQALAEQFSHAGVPVFMADVKGDLAGMSQPGGGNAKVEARAGEMRLNDFAYAACPVVFWDMYGKQGHPMRTTITEIGPLLLSRLLGLNDTQAGVLTAAFRIADDRGWLLLDLADLRALLQHLAENGREYGTRYGNISAASVGAIQRGLLQLEHEGGDRLFGEPALNLDDLLQTDAKGQGVINILAADALYHSPRTYATLLLWLLAELFETMPEIGDPDKPRLVFFFDEAHLLFDDASPALLDKIEQVMRLIRSKGVGVYFVSQNPLDIPDVVLGQLGNRIQHALRAYTPRDQKAVRAAAQTFRVNPGLDVETAITELGVGEALVSFLDEKGRPQPVERALIRPPGSRLGPVTEQERQRSIRGSLLYGHYEKQVDRASAYEMLQKQAIQSADTQQSAEEDDASEGRGFDWGDLLGGGRRQGVLETAAKSAARAIGNALGRQIIRGVLGSLGGRRR